MERSRRANRGQNYARWAMENRLDDERAPKRTRQIEDDPYVSCVCGETEGDESELIECTKCGELHHKECIDEISDPYVCAKCQGIPASKRKSDRGPTSNKVRQSVVTALVQVFTKQIIPQAIAAGNMEPKDEEYATQLATDIEAALYAEHAQKGTDPGPKYREKFRSLNFNLKDNKNATFQTQVITGQMSPQALATLNAEEMLNPELRKLADQVKLDSIQSSVLKEDTGPRVRKTHKGEEIVEREGEEEQKIEEGQSPEPSAQEPVTVAAPVAAPPVAEAQYDTHNFDEDLQFSPMSPASDDDFAETMSRPTKPVFWEGRLELENVADFEATAVHLGGQWTREDWPRVIDLDKNMLLKGRVDRQTANVYLHKISQRRLVAAFAIESESPEYTTLFDHYESRGKIGVLPQHSPLAKDAYLVPVRQGELPEWLGLREDELDAYFVNDKLLVGVYVLKVDK